MKSSLRGVFLTILVLGGLLLSVGVVSAGAFEDAVEVYFRDVGGGVAGYCDVVPFVGFEGGGCLDASSAIHVGVDDAGVGAEMAVNGASIPCIVVEDRSIAACERQVAWFEPDGE